MLKKLSYQINAVYRYTYSFNWSMAAGEPDGHIQYIKSETSNEAEP